MSPRQHHPDDASEDAPIRISESRWYAATGSVVGGAVALVGAAVFLYAQLVSTDNALKTGLQASDVRSADHEQRIRALEATEGRIDANLQQIKDWLAEDRRRKMGDIATAAKP